MLTDTSLRVNTRSRSRAMRQAIIHQDATARRRRVLFNPTTMSHKITKENCDVNSAVAASSIDDLRLRVMREKRSEGGYTLVALLALMTIFAILAMAVAPSIQQQNMRAKEAEAVARGEEVAEAIRLYVRAHPNNLPTSMDQLLEGISRGTKKIQILRSEAGIDPLTGGQWRLIQANNPAVIDFMRAVTTYAGAKPPVTNDPQTQILKQGISQVVPILDIKSSSDSSSSRNGDDTGETEGPFIGVASRDKRDAVMTYYGIDYHSGWIFTPAINPRCDLSTSSCE